MLRAYLEVDRVNWLKSISRLKLYFSAKNGFLLCKSQIVFPSAEGRETLL